MTPSEELLSAYLDDELSSQERVDVERRLASDSQWRETLEKLQEVRGWVQELPVVVPSQPKSIMQMLAEQKPDSSAEPARPSDVSSISSSPASWKWMLSLAAASLVLVGTTLWWMSEQSLEVALGPNPENAASDSPSSFSKNAAENGINSSITAEKSTSAASGDIAPQFGNSPVNRDGGLPPMESGSAGTRRSREDASGNAAVSGLAPGAMIAPESDAALQRSSTAPAMAKDSSTAEVDENEVEALTRGMIAGDLGSPAPNARNGIGDTGGFGGSGGLSPGGLSSGGMGGGGSGGMPAPAPAGSARNIDPSPMRPTADEISDTAPASRAAPANRAIAAEPAPSPKAMKSNSLPAATPAGSADTDNFSAETQPAPAAALNELDRNRAEGMEKKRTESSRSIEPIDRFYTEQVNEPTTSQYFLLRRAGDVESPEFSKSEDEPPTSDAEEIKRFLTEKELSGRDARGQSAVDEVKADTSIGATGEKKSLPDSIEGIGGPVVHLIVPADVFSDLEETSAQKGWKRVQEAEMSEQTLANNKSQTVPEELRKLNSGEPSPIYWLLKISPANYKALQERWSTKRFDVTEVLDQRKPLVVQSLSDAAAPADKPGTNKSPDFIFILLQQR